MDRFSKLHPSVQLAFFTASFILIMVVNNPFYSVTAFVLSLVYLLRFEGKDAFKTFRFTLLVTAAAGIFNFLFAHYGEDMLFKIGNTEFTFEALVYGINQGITLCALIIWFKSFSQIADSDRVIYIFRFTPKLALLFSIVLGFVPRFIKKAEDIRTARAALYSHNQNTKKEKFSQSIKIMSALVTYSLESSIITADSMRARNYNPKALAKRRYAFTFADGVVLLLTSVAFFIVLYSVISGKILFVFEPEIYSYSFSPAAYVSFLIFQSAPFVLDLTEDILWKKSTAKM